MVVDGIELDRSRHTTAAITWEWGAAEGVTAARRVTFEWRMVDARWYNSIGSRPVVKAGMLMTVDVGDDVGGHDVNREWQRGGVHEGLLSHGSACF
jgi:hypothetical protein